MILHGKGNNAVDLKSIVAVTDVFSNCSTGNITIHLQCVEGEEQRVFDNIPLWVHTELEVVKSHTHVFLKVK